MAYRLALDIGTASCGLVAVALDAQGNPTDIAYSALHIFSEPLLPPKSGGIGEPKKAARRAARMARRVIDRRARRLKRIAMLASLLGIDRESVEADKGQDIHAARADAVTAPVKLEELLLILLKMAKRRGYSGGFKTQKDDDDKGIVKPGIDKLKTEMEAAGCLTLGQYLHQRFDRGETLKLKEAGLYSDRDMLVQEFNAIWDQQAQHHPILSQSRPDPVNGGIRPIRNQFFEAIFRQRPLRSVAPMVGNCSLEPSLPRSPMAQPAAEAFRIEKQLSDLRWGMGRRALPLSREQRDAVREMLNDADQINKDGKLPFKKIYARLEKLELLPVDRRSLNMERSSREDLTGNRTLRAFKDIGLLQNWQKLSALAQLRTINFLADLGSPDQVDHPDWQARFTRSLDPEMVRFIDLMVETDKFARLGNMGFQTGRASYSINALRKLTECMRSDHVDEHSAVQKCYPQEQPTGELLMQLPAHKPTGNVVVDVALGVVRRAVNNALAAMKEPPAEAVVELSRDMALGIKARGEIEKKIDKNRKQRERARKELTAHDVPATEKNVLRYLLWEQQDQRHCPYCTDSINFAQAVDGNATNFEHILPRTLTRVGRQRNHLVLAHRRCNDLKRDRTPFEAFGHDQDRWAAVTYCASVFKGKKQFSKARLLELQDYEHEVLDDESISEFSNRQYAETSWIGKLTTQWMREICPKVFPSRGTMTAHLRRIWKLDTVIAQARFDSGLPVLDTDGDKISLDDFSRYKPFWEGHTSSSHPRTDRKIDKRIDHRHHLIDALVIAQTSISLYQRMARHYKELAERRKQGEPVRLRLETEPPINSLREKTLALVQQTGIHHKPDRFSSGSFFKQTAYRKVFNEDGKSRLAIRVPVAQLTDANGSIDKARKTISDILSSGTRNIVSKAFEERVARGKTVKEALAEPIYDTRFNTESRPIIKKVAVYQRLGRGYVDGSTALSISHGKSGKFEKHYQSDGYAYVSLYQEKGKLISAESVTTFAASRRPSRIKIGEQRFFRGDTLFDPKTNKRYLVHQLLANATVRVAEITEARSWIELGAESGATSFGAKALSSLDKL